MARAAVALICCRQFPQTLTLPFSMQGQYEIISAADDAVRGRLQGVFIVVVAGGPRLADVSHGWAAAVAGTAVATAGGGLAVVVLTIVAAIAVPVFVRYRVVPSASA